MRSGGQKRPSILADALEAVIGAVYLDAGFAAAQALVHRLFEAVEINPTMEAAGKGPQDRIAGMAAGAQDASCRFTASWARWAQPTSRPLMWSAKSPSWAWPSAAWAARAGRANRPPPRAMLENLRSKTK